MRIRLAEHAKERADERGASEDEIRMVLYEGAGGFFYAVVRGFSLVHHRPFRALRSLSFFGRFAPSESRSVQSLQGIPHIPHQIKRSMGSGGGTK